MRSFCRKKSARRDRPYSCLNLRMSRRCFLVGRQLFWLIVIGELVVLLVQSDAVLVMMIQFDSQAG